MLQKVRNPTLLFFLIARSGADKNEERDSFGSFVRGGDQAEIVVEFMNGEHKEKIHRRVYVILSERSESKDLLSVKHHCNEIPRFVPTSRDSLGMTRFI